MLRRKKKTTTSQSKPYYKRRWGTQEEATRTRLLHRLARRLRFERPRYWWQERSLLQRIGLVVLAALVLWLGGMYGIAEWYVLSQRDQPVRIGATFTPRYARYLELDPHQTLQSLIYDAGIRRLRFTSYWDDMEPEPGQYDFGDLDWQFAMAEQSGSKVSLSIGLRQPRWPECHMPMWAASMPMSEWAIYLKAFMGKVIDRYKDSPSLDSYQLENEFFMSVFGKCPDFTRERLVDEFNFVKQRDSQHPVIVSRSNNNIGIPIGQPDPDISALSIYKRVWDKTLTHRYFEFPTPAWWYASFAGSYKLLRGKDTIIHELQAEPWVPEGFELRTSSVSEQDKSMNAKRLRDRISYARATGSKTIDLWGAEWWYWRKTKFNDPSLWDVVKQENQSTNSANRYH